MVLSWREVIFLFLKEPAPGILDGVVICVSKKLSRRQGDYNSIAIGMGAEYQWTFDEKCTHFIFQVCVKP